MKVYFGYIVLACCPGYVLKFAKIIDEKQIA
jgi:hypothetical protein